MAVNGRPDYWLSPTLGATVVIVLTMLGVFFLGRCTVDSVRLRLWPSSWWAFVFVILFEPYRLQRCMSFSNPWDDPLGTGYQLSNALMAFGRGEWFGVGLGHSIQKMSYLPEAHTDFMLAVLGEEFGFLGISTVLTSVIYDVGLLY